MRATTPPKGGGLVLQRLAARAEPPLATVPACPRVSPIDPGVDIGHVHLKVADIDRALGFWRDVLGFEETVRYGGEAVFLSAGGYHHHIGLNTWESKGGSPPPPGTTGLFHVAIRYPTREALADALRRLLDAGIRLDGATDHGVSEALYLRDPDGNGVELYWDRPREDWPRARRRQRRPRHVHAPARRPEPARARGLARASAPGSGSAAGPLTTVPSIAKADPWQWHSQS